MAISFIDEETGVHGEKHRYDAEMISCYIFYLKSSSTKIYLCLLTYSIHLTLKYRDIEQDINTDLLKEDHGRVNI
jgi:hypothetical protein